ncbi:MAG: hypothetical protein V2A54_00980 [Bacteroidota bacterium]
MKKIMIAVFMIATAVVANAQNCSTYFPFTKGTVLTYTDYDGKDKETGNHSMTVNDVLENAGFTEAKVTSSSYDAKSKETAKADLVMRCKAGEFYMDMKNMASGMQNMKDMTMECTSQYMSYPANLTTSSTLPDGAMQMRLLQNGTLFSTIDMKIFNRKVVAVESITTPAGTFNCIKITYDCEMKMETMGFPMTTTTSGIEWLAPGVGSVKSESYSKNGKKASSSILVSKK